MVDESLIKRSFQGSLKYKFLFLVLVLSTSPFPILTYFEQININNQTISNIKEGQVFRYDIVSQIDVSLTNTFDIETARSSFPTILKRTISIEEDIYRISKFVEVLEQDNRLLLLPKLPKVLMTNFFARFLKETAIIDSNEMININNLSNFKVIYGTNIYIPKKVIFLPLNSEEDVKSAIEAVFGKTFVPILKDEMSYVIANSIIPNTVFDRSLQEEEFQKYLSTKNIPFEIMIKKGDKIVKEGELITKERLGIVREYFNELNSKLIWKTIFIEILILILVVFSIFLLSIFKEVKNRNILTINSLFLMSSMYPQFYLKGTLGDAVLFVSLFTSFSIVNSLICGRKSTIVIGIFYTATIFLVIYSSYIVAIYWFILIVVASMMSYRIKRRSSFVIVATVIFLVSFGIYSLIHFVESFEFGNLILSGGLSFVSVFGNVLLVFLILPLYEYFFRIATPFKLYELSSLDNPLLKMLLERAPGTYYHSLNVSILAEACANEIGANSLLAKVGALYHDVGKIENAEYFTENIGGKTREDVNIYRYAEIIKEHPNRGVDLAKKYRLPIEIERIMLEHHGGGLILYFYNKALKENPNVDERLFRYPNYKPTSKESSIIFICDKIEATVRSLTSNKNIDFQKISDEIDNIILRHTLSEELSMSNLTLQDMNKIKKAIKETFKYILHQRIEYPKS
ncbi:MAG: HDIG domain-containing protein [Spirochaetia bacterium]|nr:HDIG domain-containing protein [Spirochaetota bacterium]MCX8096609.1 HDIG domain-containing protein [Spirochaetota bacterium]MDW8112056.1 HDIG domain-containing protein [Spirochaetia bacterium]